MINEKIKNPGSYTLFNGSYIPEGKPEELTLQEKISLIKKGRYGDKISDMIYNNNRAARVLK